MSVYFDTSFLFSLYIPDKHTLRATADLARIGKPLKIGSLLYFEFCQAVRLAVVRKGMPKEQGSKALAIFQKDITNEKVIFIPCDWEKVHQAANRLSEKYTLQKAHQALDILHVATALTLGVEEFLTFDAVQAELAQAEGLKTL